MYMERIEARTGRAKKAKPVGLKLAVGLLFLLFSFAIMGPWTALILLWFGAAAAGGLLVRSLKLARDVVLYAGECVVGR